MKTYFIIYKIVLCFLFISVLSVNAQKRIPESPVLATGTAFIDTNATDQERLKNEAYIAAAVIAFRNLSEKIYEAVEKQDTSSLPPALMQKTKVSYNKYSSGKISHSEYSANFGEFTINSLSETENFTLVNDKITFTSSGIEIRIDNFVPVLIKGITNHRELSRFFGINSFFLDYIRAPSGESVKARIFFNSIKDKPISSQSTP